MSKRVFAVAPYCYKDIINFKRGAYDAWVKSGGAFAWSHYPIRLLHRFCFHHGLPPIHISKKEARLRFISGHSILFDSFPDHALYEIIPLIWDCWPTDVQFVSSFFIRYDVKIAFFTSSQMVEFFSGKFPRMRIYHIPEGLNVALYHKGEALNVRTIDILEVGRKNGNFFKSPFLKKYNHVKTGNFARVFKSDEDFRKALANAKVTISVPRCDTDKGRAGDIETLTQRYWECMISRVVMVGRAPKELINLIGYDPVVNWDGHDATPLVTDILENIEDYQDLVNRNYEVAVNYASWNLRIRKIMDILSENGYII